MCNGILFASLFEDASNALVQGFNKLDALDSELEGWKQKLADGATALGLEVTV